MDNILAGIEEHIMLLFDEAVDILLLDETLFGRNNHGSHVLLALDMLASDAHIDLCNLDASLLRCHIDGPRNGFGGVLDIFHHTAFHTFRVGLAETDDFNFVALGATTDEACNFCRSDVETDDNVVKIIHNIEF